MLVDIAPRVREIRRRLAPSRRVGRVVANIPRNTAPGELPHPDPGGPPLDGRDTAPGTIERVPVGRVVVAPHAAARIVVDRRVAVALQGGARHLAPATRHVAAAGRVQGHVVARVDAVDALQDVDLAVVRPVVRIGEPERRPGGAAVGAVLDVEDEEALVVLRLRGHPDALAALRGRAAVGAVDAEHGDRIVGVREVER